jgi:hypothetical protein
MRPDSQSMSGVSDWGSLGVTHQVVATLEGETDDRFVKIIDPYSPNLGLNTYPLNSMNAMLALLVTITSTAGQRPTYLGDRPLTRSNVQIATSEALYGPEPATFIRTALNINEIYTARPIAVS